MCAKCGKVITEPIATDELIDALPELHDEFDNISKCRKRTSLKKKKEKINKGGDGSLPLNQKTLLIITMLGGGIGTITGMYWFRHKTQKLKFTLQ